MASSPSATSTPPASTTSPTASAAATAPVPAGFAPLSASFVSPLDAFVLGEEPCGASTCTALAATNDSGWSWHALAPPPSPLRDLTAVRFASRTIGYAYGPHLLDVTSDGGRTWAAAPYPGQGSGATLVQLAASAGDVVALTSAGGSATVSRSAIGRPAWSAIPGGSAPAPGNPSSLSMGINGGAGYLLSGTTLVGGAVTGTWTSAPAPCPTGLDATQKVAVASNGAVDVACSGPGQGGQYRKEVLTTYEFGAAFGPANGTASNAPAAGAVQFIDAGGPTTLAVTSATTSVFLLNGQAWDQVFGPAGAGQPVADFGFTNNFQGLLILGNPSGATGPGDGLYLTADAGETWRLVDFTATALPGPCSAGNLTLKPGSTMFGLGNTAFSLYFETTGAPCSLHGYPGVTAEGSGNRPLATATRSPTSYMVQPHPDVPVVVSPGHPATFYISDTDNPAGGATSCPTTTRLVVFPPGATATVSVTTQLSLCSLPPVVSPVFPGRQH
ncbi:MAG TPA: DUF4232 domain-containing protein [Actinomycetota bacterium]|nr:DUF4232 domain-containing protein [Actinomycetota bacterium]